MTKTRNTKRKVDLVSSHSDDEEEGPSLICATELEDPSAVSMLQSTTRSGTYNPPHTLPYKLRPGENLVYYEEYIPDVDRNEY
ncbi:MAG: hypothetical protein M3530_06615 [Thermoproteota archaeon]|nr:hypothetical protein [Thermoproteota archaeon]